MQQDLVTLVGTGCSSSSPLPLCAAALAGPCLDEVVGAQPSAVSGVEDGTEDFCFASYTEILQRDMLLLFSAICKASMIFTIFILYKVENPT